VVTTTLEFRHACIPTTEKVLAELGQSSGEFTIELVQQPTNKPASPGRGATEESRAAYRTAETNWENSLKLALQKLSPESLKGYDGVIFADTTGNLPIPDKQGFLDWIKAGHAFIGIHSASDTFHGWPAYLEMLGGEFDHHGQQTGVSILVQDSQNPATAALGKTWEISREEIYQFKRYNATNVHELLVLDKSPQTGQPGHFPLAWCKSYGKGKVFYTALGHRDDIVDTNPNSGERLNSGDRRNSVEISKAYQAHLLGGIEWALGLKQ
jgi:type 1 glutamine amidotransferase